MSTKKSLYQQIVENEMSRLALKAELARRTAVIMDDCWDGHIPMARPEENFIDPEKGYPYNDIDHKDGYLYYNYM